MVPENISIQGAFREAGGLIDGSILNEIKIYRKIYGLRTTQIKTFTVDMFRFKVSTDYKILPQIKAKDIIVVPMTPRMGKIQRSLGVFTPKKEELEVDVSQKIRILGAVKTPIVTEAIRGSNLLDLIITAGGETSYADLSHIFLVKKLKDGSYRTKVVNLRSYIENKNFEDIPYVGEGEIIYVPKERPTLAQKIWRGGFDFLNDFLFLSSAITSIIILTNQ